MNQFEPSSLPADEAGLEPASWWERYGDNVLVVLVLLVSLLGTGYLTWRDALQTREEERVRLTDSIAGYARGVQAAIDRSASITLPMAAMIRRGGGYFPDFHLLAAQLLPQYPGASSIGLAPGGVVNEVHPIAGNEVLIGFDMFAHPTQSVEANLARSSGQLTIAGPMDLIEGGRGLVARHPVTIDDDAMGGSKFWGLAWVVIRFPEVLAGVQLHRLEQQGIAWELWRIQPNDLQRQRILGTSTPVPAMPIEHVVTVANGTWVFSAAPAGGWASMQMPWIQIAISLVVTTLLTLVTRLVLQQRRGQHELEQRVLQRTRQISAARQDLQATLDALPDLLIEVGPDGTCHRLLQPGQNDPLQLAATLLGRRISDVFPETRDRMRQVLDEAIRWGRSSGKQIELSLRGGMRRVYDLSVSIKTTGVGGEPRFVVLARDVTLVKAAESDLRVAATAFDVQDGLAVTDASRQILRVNPSFTRITGYTSDEVVGLTLDILSSGEHPPEFFEAMWSSVRKVGSWRGEVRNKRKNGEVYPDWHTLTAVRGEDNEITHYVGTFNDISERKAAEDKIHHLAYFDALTGLPNRRLLMDRLRHGLDLIQRDGQHIALMFIDLDNFKTLNDTMGHDMGDLLLRQVAERLATCVRRSDTVARQGGDEFVVLLEGLPREHDAAILHAEHAGQKVIDALRQPYKLGGVEFHSTPSIGIAIADTQQHSVDDLLKQADLAMYQAKTAGRNAIRFFDPKMQAAVTGRAELEQDIRQAISAAQFVLYYQQQVDAQGRIVGAEVLIRWPHPTRGMVSPGQFIPVAEETNLIVPLGNWVIETACQQLAIWAKSPSLADMVVSVNVSARQFRQPDFVSYVRGVVEYTGADPSKLKLELTESMLVHDVNETIDKMNQLKAGGIGFSLDDFGTGYSSLTYLKRMPIDHIKIDQSFVRDVMTDPNDAAIAKTVINLGHSLGMFVVAEGVETEEQVAFLSFHGCDIYQGYHFGRPVPVDQFERQVLT